MRSHGAVRYSSRGNNQFRNLVSSRAERSPLAGRSNAIDGNLLVRSKRGRTVEGCGVCPADARGCKEEGRSGDGSRHRMDHLFLERRGVGFAHRAQLSKRGFVLGSGLVPEIDLFRKGQTAEAEPDGEQPPGARCYSARSHSKPPPLLLPSCMDILRRVV